jgi:3-dehydroquinate dehydratase
MRRILLVQGANLTYLGKREPAIYGSTTPEQLDAMLQDHAHAKGYELRSTIPMSKGTPLITSMRRRIAGLMASS